MYELTWSLISPHDPTFWLSCNNSLTSPTVLLWPIHHHSHNYFYQLSSSCEQKPIIRNHHIYERKTVTTMAAKIFDTRTQSLHFSGKNVRLSSLPSSKTFLKTTEHSWTKTILSRGGRRKLLNSSLMNKLIRIEWVSEWVSAIGLATTLLDVNIHEQKGVKRSNTIWKLSLFVRRILSERTQWCTALLRRVLIHQKATLASSLRFQAIKRKRTNTIDGSVW